MRFRFSNPNLTNSTSNIKTPIIIKMIVRYPINITKCWLWPNKITSILVHLSAAVGAVIFKTAEIFSTTFGITTLKSCKRFVLPYPVCMNHWCDIGGGGITLISSISAFEKKGEVNAICIAPSRSIYSAIFNTTFHSIYSLRIQNSNLSLRICNHYKQKQNDLVQFLYQVFSHRMDRF